MSSRPPEARSGRFVLRLHPSTHALLGSAAREEGVSLNEYCARRLTAVRHDGFTEDAAAGLVSRAAAVLGDALIGIVLCGSRVRGDAAADSDLDAIVAAERETEITRGLYARWDAHAGFERAPRADPHFAHLPVEGAPSNLWGEAAMEGVVVFDRGGRLAKALVGVRRAAAEGRLRRRVLHGQPYWAAEP